MKPRNQRERECVRLSDKLPYLTEAQEAYAFEHCFEHQAAPRSKKHHTFYCLDCGAEFTDDSNRKTAICPNCHHKLTKDGVRRKRADKQTFQVIATTGGYQVVRTYYVKKVTQQGKPCKLEINECIRRFMKPGLKDIVIALSRVAMHYYDDLFDYDSEMSIKTENIYYRSYDIWATIVYPRQSVLPMLKRNGYSDWLKKNTQFSTTFHRLMENSQYETIAKAGRYDLWKNLKWDFIKDHWPQVKMVMRHNYYPEDYEVWVDTVSMADRLGYDTHSPKYICPDNLHRLHDQLVRKQNERNREDEIALHKKDEKKFRRTHKQWLGICIVADDITIKPLQNYAEFYDEGKIMHHCVETYFGRSGSLILSAKRGDKRLATIELSTKDFHIVQCRSKCNEKPKQYDQICGIINDNISLFKHPNQRHKSIYTPSLI